MSTPIEPGPTDPRVDTFPISWPHTDDSKLSWRLDAHLTSARKPLSLSVSKAILGGFEAAFHAMGLPFQLRIEAFNGYIYSTQLPLTQATGNQPPSSISLKQSWRQTILPESQNQLRFFSDGNWDAASPLMLLSQFENGLERARRLGEMHARAAFPAILAMSSFEELYQDLFPDSRPLEALRLLQGFDNRTLAGDKLLWQLSQTVRQSEPLRRKLCTDSVAQLLRTLPTDPAGHLFWEQFMAYLEQYGRRLNEFAQLSKPSWLEEPTLPLQQIRQYVQQPGRNPLQRQRQLAAEREQLLKTARKRLAAKPTSTREQFESMLSEAQHAVGIKEDNHWLLQALFYEIRRLSLVVGRRLHEQKKLLQPEAVFYLTGDELVDNDFPDQDEIESRSALYRYHCQLTPPQQIGAPLQRKAMPDVAFSRGMQKADVFSRARTAPQAALIRGQAASGGCVRGTIRIVTKLADAGRLAPGEILVTRATTPPWTPLFQTAAAVVTDSGGVLSHCAVIAREYQIPAVVGTGDASQRLIDGHMAEVDGSAGIVRILTNETDKLTGG